MPLIGPAIKSKFKDTIYSGLKREFSAAAGKGDQYSGVADEFWLKLASAISDIAMDLVDEMHQNAMVSPGIPVATAGSPVAQTGATTAPGKIL
jgi:hypothetical protein